jgi:hypothetical protein
VTTRNPLRWAIPGQPDVEAAELVQRLVEELKRLRRGEALREPAKLANAHVLRALAKVIRRRDDDSEAFVDTKGVLLEAIQELTGESLRIACGAFAVGANDAPSLTGRRTDVSRELSLDLKTVIRREDRLMVTLAHQVVERATVSQLRDSRTKLERRDDGAESLAVDWLDRFRHYYRMWSDLQGLANDFKAYLYRRDRDPNDPEIESYPRSSLWYFALFLVHLDRFTEEEGGLWLLSDADAEVALADAINRITWHPPAGDPDHSWLRTAIRATPGAELIGFLHVVDTTGVGPELLGRWERWLAACSCDLDEPDPECQVHEVVRLAERYCETIDREWYRIADWYRLPPQEIGTKVTATPTLFEDWTYRMDEE